MLAIRDSFSRQMGRHRGAMEQASESHMLPGRKSAAGIITLLLLAVGLYYVFPEIRRYLRLERM
jgi:hypothetical protein